MKVTQTGVGATAASRRLYRGLSKVALQIDAPADGLTTYRVNGRVSPDAPWVQVVAPATADAFVYIDWLPELQLEVTAGTGVVSLYIGD